MSNWKPAFCMQIEIDADNKYIDVDLLGGAGEQTATMTEGTYDDIYALADELEARLQVIDATFSVTVNEIGRCVIARTGNFEILWESGTNGSSGLDQNCAERFGFDDAADDDTPADSYTSDDAVSHTWFCPTVPRFDSKDRAAITGAKTFVSMRGSAYHLTAETYYFRTFRLQWLEADKTFYAEYDPDWFPFDYAWWFMAQGYQVRIYYHYDEAAPTLLGTYHLVVPDNADLRSMSRYSESAEYYSAELTFVREE